MSMDIYVCLLRGINVGGHKRILMKPLRELITTLGLSRVRSYLQSGNIVFESNKGPGQLTNKIAAAIEDSFDMTVGIQLRNGREMMSIAQAHPFAGDAGDELAKLQVGFLESPPSEKLVHALGSTGPAGERWQLIGREVYAYYPAGCARSKITTRFWEKGLGQSCTMRNWKTVTALRSMIEAAPS